MTVFPDLESHNPQSSTKLYRMFFSLLMVFFELSIMQYELVLFPNGMCRSGLSVFVMASSCSSTVRNVPGAGRANTVGWESGGLVLGLDGVSSSESDSLITVVSFLFGFLST